MCARYQISVPLEILGQRFNAKVPNRYFQSKIEGYPGTEMPVVTNIEPGLFSFFQWGLVPNWCRDESIGQKLFNARCETLAEKPSFAKSFLTRRCLVPADSFIEWHKVGEKKLPVRFTLNDNSPFAMAGIFDTWESKEKIINSFTIITTKPNSIVGEIHDRMPVVLLPEQEKVWLTGTEDEIKNKGIFHPFPSNLMKFELLK